MSEPEGRAGAVAGDDGIPLGMTQPVKWYPLRLEPRFERAPWHGTQLAEYLRPCGGPAVPDGTGVWWELVDRPGDSSVVANGPLAGRSLGELTAAWPRALVGSRHLPGTPFPLCLRLLDVGRRLPVLVDPDEGLCRGTPGLQTNTKFWYCLAAAADSEIGVGIRGRVTALQFIESLADERAQEVLQGYPAHPGDSYLIPAGRVHSAGGGTLLWELGRCPVWPLEASGTVADPGALPVRAIHFEDRQVARVSREMGVAAHTRKIPLVGHCPYFVVEEIRLVDHWFDQTNGTSFHLLCVVRGTVELQTASGTECLPAGSVRLLPAQFGGYRAAVVGGPAELLRARLQSLK